MWYLPDYSDRYRYSWLQIHISTICGKSQIGNIIRKILKLISSWCRINVSLNWVSISSGNGFYWTNAALLSIGPLGTNFNEIRMGTQNFSSMKMLLKMSSAKVAAILSRGRWVYKIRTSFRSASCSFLHKIHALPLTFDRRYSRKFSTLELGFHTHTHTHTHTHISIIAFHYNYVIMGAMASQITDVSIVYSTVWSGADQRKYQSSASLDFVSGIHRWPVNSPHKGPVTRKMFPFDDVIMGTWKTLWTHWPLV